MTNLSAVQKPKRRYTVTERVLAACRINVEKARKAALERRYCATRGTHAEHEAAHANLELAQRVKREDDTYKYCSVFRHGLLAASLERSLVMAGETHEEYDAHLARFAALPGVFDFDAASQEVKLAQACGFASWRRIRANRLQGEWALRMMTYHLHAAIRERHTVPAEGQAKGQGEASLVAFENEVPNLVMSSALQPGPVMSSAAVLSGATRNLALKMEPGLGQPSLTPEGFLQLAIALEHAGEDWPSVWRPIRKLNNRFDQLWCRLVQELGEPEPFLARLSHTERAAMRLSPIVANFRAQTAEVLGNPLIRPKCVLELLKTRPVYVKPAPEWACSRIPYEVEDRMSAEVRRSRVYLQSLENKQVTLLGNLDYHLLRAARRPHEKAESSQGPSLAVELPRSFEEFLALVEAAFGQGSGSGDQGSETRDSGFGRDAEDESEGPSMDPRLRGGDADRKGDTAGAVEAMDAAEPLSDDVVPRNAGILEPLSKDVIPAKAGIHESSEEAESRNPAPNRATPPTLRGLAQLLWDSATLPRRRAEEEARLLAEYLTEYAARLASGDPRDEKRRQHLADQVLKLFRQVDEPERESIGINRRTRLALYDTAVARYGKQPEFECLIDSNDRSEELYSKFYRIYWPEAHRILGRGGGQEAGRQETEDRRKKQEGRRKKPGARSKKARKAEARSKKKREKL